MKIIACTIACVIACHTYVAFAQDLPADPGAVPLAEIDQWVLSTLGPPDLVDPLDALDGDVFCQELDAGDLSIVTGGILMSEAKAMRCAEYKLAYQELRLLYAVDIAAWSTKQQIYVDELDLCQKKIMELTKKTEPSWWDSKKGVISFFIGVLLGAALTVGVLYSVGGRDG